MFNIFQCFTRACIKDISRDDKEEIPIELDQERNLQESSKNPTFQNSINHLKNAEKQALDIVERAKKKRKEYLLKAESAAGEIIRPYYDLADQEFNEIELSLNRELHIKTLENVLDNQDQLDQIDEIDLHEKKKVAIEYIYSKVSDVKLVLENPKYVKSQLEKHKVSKSHKKINKIRNRLMSWSSKNYTEKEQEMSKIKSRSKRDKHTNKEKTVTFYLEEKDSTASTIELDEDYSRIDNMYSASRVINSFNTIHLK